MRALLVLAARLALARGFGYYLSDSMDGCVDSMCEDGYTCATRYDRQYCEGTTYFDDHRCPDMSGTGCEDSWNDLSWFTDTGGYGTCVLDDNLYAAEGYYRHARCLDDGTGQWANFYFTDSACITVLPLAVAVSNQGDPTGGYDHWTDRCSGRRRLQS